MKPRPLTTKSTWLALTLLPLLPFVFHHPSKPPPLVGAIPTVNFTSASGYGFRGNGNATHGNFDEPEIPYEELEEPRVLPLHGAGAFAAQSEDLKELPQADEGAKVAFSVPASSHDSNVVPVLQLVLEEPESNDEPFSTTQGYPTFSAYDNIVPSKPLNLSVLEVTSTTIKITWREPEKQNGAIHGYRVYYVHQNQTLLHLPILKAEAAVNSVYTYTLSNLKPYTDYKMIVAAFTKKFDGEPSEVFQRTDIAGPSAPKVVNLTCHSLDALFFGWRIPATYYNTIDYYIVSYRNELHSDFRDIRITANASIVETSMIIPNLTSNMVYEVKVRAASISVINPKQLILGSYSEPKKISLQPNCEKLPPASQRQSYDDYNLAVLAGIVVSCFGLLLVVLAFLLWKKCFHAAYYYLDDPPPSSQGAGGGSHGPSAAIIDWEAPSEVAGEVRSSISVAEFAKHVASLHADGDIGFSKEYEAIQGEALNDEYPSEYSQHPDNKGKNRYLNVIAYDHSRVHLRQIPGQKKHLDYINANFIDGYQKSRAFIATQGPLPGTFDCFWRMIWEQKVAIIVMITNLVERGRRKCDMYWPKDGVETYGVIQVKLIREEVMATYTVRTFQIKHTKLKKKKAQMEKMVYQYHYTNWPDHGTPDHPLPVINFVKKSTTANPSDAGPIVVHCSAGVGRTGTYIVLDAILKQIESKGMLNVFGFLRYIRAQRNYMVQTEEQYIFIHDALVEAIDSGETNIKVDAIGGLVNNIEFIDGQYKLITSYQPKEINLTSALKPVNAIKNRSSLVPLEGSRVHLTPKPGVEGSDYINATWLHGFRRLRDFIVTQHPLIETFKDFWQMVWDHNAQTVVLLSSADNMSFLQFWPIESEPIESDYYRIRMVSETSEQNNYIVRNFVIQSIQDDYELTVRMFENPQWPDMANPRSIYDFVVRVHERVAEYRNGPIVIVDRYGGFQACQFCCISSLAMQLEQDQTANVYTYAKLYHNKRPGIWSSYEDIRQIYRILSYMPKELGLLKCTELRTEFDDAAIMTATPDLYSKICSNGSINTHLNSGIGTGGMDGTGNGGTPMVEGSTGNGTNNGGGPTTTIQNGGTVIVKMNGEDNDELSVVVATSNHLNLDHNQT